MQPTLFGIGLGAGHLFGAGVLEQYLREHRDTPIDNLDSRTRQLQDWLNALAATEATERTLKPKFVSDVLCEILGYTLYPVPAGRASSVWPEPNAEFIGISRPPDAMLGCFTDEQNQFTCAVELKTPGADLDAPQPRENNESPVEQGFYYATHILGVRWLVVSDMRIIRLYSVESIGEYEEIDLASCLNERGDATDDFRRLYFLLHHNYLVEDHDQSQIALLYAKSTDRRLQIRDSFYIAYYDIRKDLYEAIKAASVVLDPPPSRQELLEATQRLLDRLLFIYYCEDHPQQFIRNQTIEGVANAASQLPGPGTTKVYQYLKHLFREVDAGSSPSSGTRVAAYNGELFKDHRIIDHIDLPDSLHRKVYLLTEPNGTSRRIEGVWGLHVFDFWTEINEHLLGHIFEQSLSDLENLGTRAERSAAEKLAERKEKGIFYTSSILSDFLSVSAIQSLVNEHAPLSGKSAEEILISLRRRLEYLRGLRAVDFACGSGAFLVSVYGAFLQHYWRLRSSIIALSRDARNESLDLISMAESISQASVLRDCIFGVDLLPQAVEIAKLSLWLRSARKDERVLDLSDNIIAGDSLDVASTFSRIRAGEGSFDLVIGNPPWGGEMDPAIYASALATLGLFPTGGAWDSWELFLLLGLRALREGGRLALVVPDSFLYSDKAELRKLLFNAASPEKIHNLGPDWFGKDVRMGTMIIQARRGNLNLSGNILSMLLTGKMRGQVIRGKIPVTQVEAQRTRTIPIRRTVNNPRVEVEIFRGSKDDEIMGLMESKSIPLASLCERARGEEINKAGIMWQCPSCLMPTTPGEKKKGGGYKNKQCRNCGLTLTSDSVNIARLVEITKPSSGESVPFIDGDDIRRRYTRARTNKWLRLGVSGWPYKNEGLYLPPKLLVRQAGIGLVATLDETNSRCPQSVYMYRLRQERIQEGYQHEFVLAALLSRAMAYFIFKKYGEVDPAKAHAKLTHERLEVLPIPSIDFTIRSQKQGHSKIVENVRKLLNSLAEIGESEDNEIEQLLREMWGITPENGAYINGEFSDLPDSQVISDLFPGGRTRPVISTANSALLAGASR